MNISYCDDYKEMSTQAKDLIVKEIQQNPNLLLCAATGSSPLGTYQLLSEFYNNQQSLFQKLRIIKLDEWGGVAMQEPQTCESFLQQYLLKPLQISKERYFAFDSDPQNPQAECERMQAILQAEGPIDLCMLGLGKNGHIAFNEPGEVAYPYCHIAALSAQSMQHDMAQAMKKKPTYGMTIGMRDILQAKKIIILITGSNKNVIFEKLLQQKLSTHLPASFLWLHPDVTCLVDSNTIK